jgi:hypothetical protein
MDNGHDGWERGFLWTTFDEGILEGVAPQRSETSLKTMDNSYDEPQSALFFCTPVGNIPP